MKRNYWLGFLIAFITAIIFDLLIGWPSALIAGIFAGLCFRKASTAFRIGFVGVSIAWLLMVIVPALWSPIVKLAGKLVQILGLSANFSFLMFFLPAMVGGILGGLGAANAAAIYRFFSKQNDTALN